MVLFLSKFNFIIYLDKKKAFKTSHRKDESTADAREKVLQEVDKNKEWRVSKIGKDFLFLKDF